MDEQSEKDLQNLEKLASDILKIKEAYNLTDADVEKAMDNILDNISKLLKKRKK